jgi:NAD(P)H-hydrate epimerase
LVSVSSPDDALAIHGAHLTAIMIRKLNDIQTDLKDDRMNAWCIGPAAGVTKRTRKNVIDLIRSGKKVVADADGLSVFEDKPLELFNAINSIDNVNCVLTPHSGEFVRLFPYLKILDKITATRSAAKLSGAVVINKGADTVISAPDGRTVISNNAPATLATAGTGDVLAGLVTGLQAQNMSSFDAACAAVWIHCECANAFGVGLISEDLEKKIPEILTDLGTF